MNRICWQGAQYMYNRVSGKFDYCEVWEKKARRGAPCLFFGIHYLTSFPFRSTHLAGESLFMPVVAEFDEEEHSTWIPHACSPLPLQIKNAKHKQGPV
jgi:hypothetical protein